MVKTEVDATPDLHRADPGEMFGEVRLNQIIDGRYQILERLGVGGMGAVYKVEHIRMGKIVALKLLSPELARKAKGMERFRLEARLISKLDHPNIISVFDFGATESGTLYIVMEYVPVLDLARLLREEGPLPEQRALRIAIQVLGALAEA